MCSSGPLHGREKFKNLEPDGLFPCFLSIITVPPARDSLSCEVQEGFIEAEKSLVDGLIEQLKILMNCGQSLDHVPAPQLDDEWWNPRMTEADNAIQMLLANKSATVSG